MNLNAPIAMAYLGGKRDGAAELRAAVLDLHAVDQHGWCRECLREAWPCKTVKAVGGGA